MRCAGAAPAPRRPDTVKAWGAVTLIDRGMADDKLVCGAHPLTPAEKAFVLRFFRFYAKCKGMLNFVRGHPGATCAKAGAPPRRPLPGPSHGQVRGKAAGRLLTGFAYPVKRVEPNGHAMKLLSWNIQWGAAWTAGSTPRASLQTIRQLGDFDAICLQEVAINFPGLPGSHGEDQVAELSAGLPGYTALFGAATDVPDGRGGRSRFGNAIFSRLPVGQVCGICCRGRPS